jgi:hypothetical protein
MPSRVWTLFPSDFAFLWEECRRCFYLKAAYGIRQPSRPMAAIFKRIEALQMRFYDGRPTSELSAALPPGRIRCGEKWVESEPIAVPGRASSCVVAGKLDSLIEFEGGGWGVLDFKTTEARGEKAALYARQLHAYAWALEHAARAPQVAKAAPAALSPVTRLGLLCFEPTELRPPGPGRHAYEGEVRWIEIPRDDGRFLEFLAQVVEVLEGSVPAPAESCDWCRYARTMAEFRSPASEAAASPEERCPKCGGPMVPRNGRYGPFLSCARYPECRGTRRVRGGRRPVGPPG